MLKPKSKEFAYPTIDMDPSKVVALADHLIKANVHYKLGAKIAPLAQMDGIDAVDCSGFVRWLIYHATNKKLTIPDGSFYQQEWCEEAGFKVSTDGGAKDGAIRIAFLPKIGNSERHVALIHDGFTMESHGGVGPNRRAWGSQSWMRKTKVFVLTPPVSA